MRRFLIFGIPNIAPFIVWAHERDQALAEACKLIPLDERARRYARVTEYTLPPVEHQPGDCLNRNPDPAVLPPMFHRLSLLKDKP